MTASYSFFSSNGSFSWTRFAKLFLLVLPVLAPFIPILNGQTIPGEYTSDANTVLLMHMNEPSGSVAADASGLGNHGTASGTTVVDAVFGKARDFDGVNDFVDTKKILDVVDTFTIEALVYPTALHEIDIESNSSNSGALGQKKYAIWPTQGDCAWGPGHAGVGISVGTNGVSVYEHADGYLPAVLVWEGSLTTWTHVAVVYRDRKPELYINGRFEKMGLKSSKIVHPSAGKGDACAVQFGGIGGGTYGFFQGLIDEIRISNKARTPDEFIVLPYIDFGRVLMGRTVSDSITVTNNTNSEVSFGPILLNGPDVGHFSTDTSPFSLARGESKKHAVYFTPRWDGPIQAVLTISTNAGNINVDLHGLGIPAIPAIPGEYVSDANTVLLMHMNESSGSVATDASGLGNHGTATGTTVVNAVFGKARDFDGVDDFVDTRKLLDVVDTFTIEALVYPTAPHEIDIESKSGNSGALGQKKYAIWPTQGDCAWGPGHAGVGISVGTNGVSVYEHADGYLPAVLVWEGSLTTWTHIAVVYRDRKPELYINGRFEKMGLKSSKIVHPSIGKGSACAIQLGGIGGGTYGYFKGRIDEIRISDKARMPEEFVFLPEIDFGEVLLGTSANDDLTVTNPNTTVLRVRAIALSGTYANKFSVDTTPFTLDSCASKSLQVSFTPDNEGEINAMLIISTDAGDMNARLSGAGIGASFTRITTGVIVSDGGDSYGCSWGDYDKDGDLDLFVANNGQNNLYQNSGSGIFTRITTGSIVNDRGDSKGGAWGDFDNDNDLDLFVVNDGGQNNFLYFNNGDGTFTKIDTGKIVNDGGFSKGGSLGDYDNDGDLDIFVANTSEDFLYANNGDGSFSKIIAGDIVTDKSDSEGSSWADFDNDGDLDLFVVGSKNRLYRNDDNGVFTNIANSAIVTEGGGRSGAWGDYDNDGDLDLFVIRSDGSYRLYSNDGNGSFYNVTEIAKIDESGDFLGSSWGDYDNDGDLDLFMTNRNNRNNFLYSNDGDGTFTRITIGDIIYNEGFSNACSWADCDNDGDLDLFVANSNNQNNFVFYNNGNSNHWLNIKCTGTVSNRTAIGAKVRVKAAIQGKPVWQLQEIAGQNGAAFSSQNSFNAEFGLGDATIVDSIRIEWPSGIIDEFMRVQSNQFLNIAEGAGSTSPLMSHSPVLFVNAGETVAIVANVTDDIGVREVTLNYHKGGDGRFFSSPMTLQTGAYRGSIPDTMVTNRGVEYFIEAMNVSGVKDRVPASGAFSVQVNVPELMKGTPQPGGSEQTAYRLFSVPLDLDNKSARAVLEDDFGPYNIFKWRCYDVRADQTKTEFPNVSDITPGKSLWLIVRDQGKVLDAGAGKSNSTSKEFAITLHQKWNLVANPFNFPIHVSKLRRQSGEAVVLRSYTGTWNDPSNNRVVEMQPFEGYAVFNNLTEVDTLFVNPDSSTSGTATLKEVVHRSARRQPPDGRSLRAPLQTFLWSIRIHAQCQQARDGDNIVGIIETASKEWDEMDYPEPPPIGEYVSVYFPHRDWNRLAKTYCIDARPEPTEGEVWDFEVKTNIHDKVNLTLEGVATVPSEFEVWLMDEAMQIIQNLRKSLAYSVTGSEYPKALKLVVGKREFIVRQLAEINLIPVTFELSQNFPNPFNPVTTIRYGLPQAVHVSLTIYNLLGEEVAVLVNNEHKAAGYHAAIWDGRGKNGDFVASGVYVYRIKAGSLVDTKKLVLVK